MLRNLAADALGGIRRTKKRSDPGLVFAQESKQQMLRLYRRCAKLAAFVSREKDHAPRPFCVPLKHSLLPSQCFDDMQACSSRSFWTVFRIKYVVAGFSPRSPSLR